MARFLVSAVLIPVGIFLALPCVTDCLSLEGQLQQLTENYVRKNNISITVSNPILNINIHGSYIIYILLAVDPHSRVLYIRCHIVYPNPLKISILINYRMK